MKCCSQCGQAVEGVYEIYALNLKPHEVILIQNLIKDKISSKYNLINKLYTNETRVSEENCLAQLVFRMNQKLKKTRFMIISKYGYGYQLVGTF